MFVFDEVKYAKQLLVFDAQKLKIRDYFILAKYFRYQGFGSSKIQNKIIEIFKNASPDFNEVMNRTLISSIVSNAMKHEAKVAPQIDITKAEISIISMNSINQQKILFVLIILAKYNKHFAKTEYDGYFVQQNINDIFDLAKIKGLNKEQKYKIIAELNDRGLVHTTYQNSYQILYVKNDSEVELSTIPDNDVIYVFEKYIGERILTCECGSLFKPNSNSQKYCKGCARDKQLLLQRNSMKKMRNVKE
jgi:hypothetical protein